MRVKVTKQTSKTDEKIIEIPDKGDFFANVAEKCGWTDKRKEKYDNPLWYLSCHSFVKVEKIGE